ncbi:MAG: arsenate reductase family protein [Enterococcus sp.]
MYTFYWYPKCSTCKKAKAWLDDNQISYQAVDMITNVPSSDVIAQWMEHSELPIRRFFNTSGIRYRELDLKNQVGDFSITKASQLLSTDGMLLKRPIVVEDNRVVAIGFNENTYEGAIHKNVEQIS